MSFSLSSLSLKKKKKRRNEKKKKATAENVSYNRITYALWPDPGHFWNAGKSGWQKVLLSLLSVSHSKPIKKWASARWSLSLSPSFMAHFDIWIVFSGVHCRYSEVPNECKHSRLKYEGEKGEEVASAGENEMPDSYYGAALAGVICG